MVTYNAVGQITAGPQAVVQRVCENLSGHLALNEGADEDVVKGGLKVLDPVDEILEGLRLDLERVAADKLLSVVGQQEQAVNLVVDACRRLAFLEKAAKDRRDAAAAERKTLEAIPKPTGDLVVAKLEDLANLTWLRGRSMAGRMLIYAKGDVSIIRAVKTAPAGEVLIEPEFLKRIDRELLERSKPEQLRRVQTLEYVADQLSLLAGAISATLGSYGRIVDFKAPPIRTVDLGRQNTQAAPARSIADAPPVGGQKFI